MIHCIWKPVLDKKKFKKKMIKQDLFNVRTADSHRKNKSDQSANYLLRAECKQNIFILLNDSI